MDGCSSVTLLVWAHVPDQLLKICVHNAAFEECNLLHRTRYYHDVQLLQNAFDLLGNLNVLDLFLMMDDWVVITCKNDHHHELCLSHHYTYPLTRSSFCISSTNSYSCEPFLFLLLICRTVFLASFKINSHLHVGAVLVQTRLLWFVLNVIISQYRTSMLLVVVSFQGFFRARLILTCCIEVFR